MTRTCTVRSHVRKVSDKPKPEDPFAAAIEARLYAMKARQAARQTKPEAAPVGLIGRLTQAVREKIIERMMA